jgi:hypothetical protein
MVPTRKKASHGLDRKYKKWRRQKSIKAQGKGGISWKHQLRGHERLLAKLVLLQQQQPSPTTRNNNNNHNDDLTTRISSLQHRIDDLKRKITTKEHREIERHHAQQSHGKRFLERQKLVRMLRHIQKEQQQQQQQRQFQKKQSDDDDDDDYDDDNTNDDNNHNDNHYSYSHELWKLALDMVYVAHYPHDIDKYRPLFRHGIRCIDDEKHLQLRANIRHRIVTKIAAAAVADNDDQGTTAAAHIAAGDDDDDDDDVVVADADHRTRESDHFQRVSWIDPSLYAMLPLTWTVADERQTFGSRATATTAEDTTSDTLTTIDERFIESRMEGDDIVTGNNEMNIQARIVAEAEKLEALFNSHDDQIQSNDSSPEMSDDDNDDDNADDNAASDENTRGTLNDDNIKGTHDNDTVVDSEPFSTRSKPVHKVQHSIQQESDELQFSNNKTRVHAASSKGDSCIDTSNSSTSNSNKKHSQAYHVTNDKKSHTHYQEYDSDDDFFVSSNEVNDDRTSVFDPSCTSMDKATYNNYYTKSDKSKGWLTQRQRPGQFKNNPRKKNYV